MINANYWQVRESFAAQRREKAFQEWKASGYADLSAHQRFVTAFEDANNCRTQQKAS